MNFLLNSILFLAGISVGSFINVISLRYNPEEKILSKRTIGGRSRCPYCHKELRWFELIPLLSFLWQKGKCRGCGRFLFWQYPVVEILSGLIFLLVPLKIFNFKFSILNFQTILNYQLLITVIWVLIFLIFLLISIIDFRHYIIPDQLNLSLAFIGFFFLILNQFTNLPISQLTNPVSFLGYYGALINPFSNIWVNHFFAAFIAMFFFGAIILLTRGKGMGWGDFKLAGALGLIFGWPDILIAVMLSFVIGSIISIVLMLKRKKTMKDAVPFGPFLVIGATTVFFFGYQLVNLYFKLFIS
ncbi:MAG: prepilin peptidase [Candidatus Wolfebacteria bacterium]|nr:prepilin peptidase [Candidatus Wolfebacteria bacterium]